MTWFDVLLKHWSRLSEEVQEKVREYYHLRPVAEQLGGQFLPERVQQLEEELQAEPAHSVGRGKGIFSRSVFSLPRRSLKRNERSKPFYT